MLTYRDFNINDLKLNSLYEDSTLKLPQRGCGFVSKKIKDVFGDYLYFKNVEQKPYMFSSFVCSVDGKIAYNDCRKGTLIAKNNFKDPLGGHTDFWIMNVLRANSDGVIIGAGALRDEPNLSCHIFDKTLENDRLKNGLAKYPINIIVSKSGNTIPFEHTLLNQTQIPIIIATPFDAVANIQSKLNLPFVTFPLLKSKLEVQENKQKLLEIYNQNKGRVLIIPIHNNTILLYILKIIGLHRVSVEASQYTHSLIQDQLLDEIFLNTSNVYVGGNALGIGYNERDMAVGANSSFTSTNHPHTKLLSLYMHSTYFLYGRYEFLY